MKHDYHEGDEATKRFETLATAVFRAPKPVQTVPKPKRTPKKTSKG